MDWIIRILIVLAAAWFGTILLAFVFQRSLLYFPDNTAYTPNMTSVPEMQAVHYKTSDGLTLTSWYAAPSSTPPSTSQQARPTVLLFHGNGGNIAHRAGKARLLIDAGFGVLLAEYRGYGGNAGAPSEDGLMMDGRAALDFVRNRGVANDQVVLFGESLGTGVAVALAAEMEQKHPPAALILEAGYSSMSDVAGSHYPFLPIRYLLRDRFPSIDRIGNMPAPLLMVHGTADEIIGAAIGQRLFAAANAPKEMRLIEGAGHNDVWDRGGDRAMMDFLERLFPHPPNESDD